MKKIFDFSQLQLEKLTIHKIGNKIKEGGYVMSPTEYEFMDGNVEELLLKYFFIKRIRFFANAKIIGNRVKITNCRATVSNQSLYKESTV